MRLLVLSLSLLSLASCQQKSDGLTMKGTVEGSKEVSQMFFQQIDANNQPYVVDTVQVKNGKFSFDIPQTDKTELGFFSFENINGNVVFFLENKSLNATIYTDSIFASKITGSKENDLYNNFTAKASEFQKRKQAQMEEFQTAQQNMDNQALVRLQTESALMLNEEKVYKKEFIEKNTNTLLAMMMLSEMLARQEITAVEANKILQNIKPELQEHSIVKQMKKSINQMRVAEVGSIAPNFTGPTPDGDMLSLNEVLGKVTLIDFWASWCRPCRVENPNVVRVHNQYKDRGFNIISVSLDRPGQRAQWLKAIEDDQMDWYHISNLQFWDDPIARQYGVRSIPATYILDQDGKIVAKDLRGAALGQKVGELLDSMDKAI